jgi:hypothetical protein
LGILELNKYCRGLFLCLFTINPKGEKQLSNIKCTFPKTCIWYYESDFKSNNPNSPKTTCTLHGWEINYSNIDKIEGCEDHQTFKQLKDNRKIET